MFIVLYVRKSFLVAGYYAYIFPEVRRVKTSQSIFIRPVAKIRQYVSLSALRDIVPVRSCRLQSLCRCYQEIRRWRSRSTVDVSLSVNKSQNVCCIGRYSMALRLCHCSVRGYTKAHSSRARKESMHIFTTAHSLGHNINIPSLKCHTISYKQKPLLEYEVRINVLR